MPVVLARVRHGCHWTLCPAAKLMERSSHGRLRQSSSHISSLTIASGLSPFIESFSCSTAIVCVASLPLRKACIHLLLPQDLSLPDRLDLHYASSGLHANIASKHN
jgi:hypothetical protein